MTNPIQWFTASAQRGSDLLNASRIPIRKLHSGHRDLVRKHLGALSEPDRYLRFGYLANEAHIDRYVESLDFERDEVFGIFHKDLHLAAVAHLAYLPPAAADAGASVAEFGVSVEVEARGQGFGKRLFGRCELHARNASVSTLFIHALRDNAAMLHIAHSAGATLESDHAEVECWLRLRPPSLDSRLAELWEDQLGQADYRFKVQAADFRDRARWLGLPGMG